MIAHIDTCPGQSMIIHFNVGNDSTAPSHNPYRCSRSHVYYVMSIKIEKTSVAAVGELKEFLTGDCLGMCTMENVLHDSTTFH